MTSSRDETIRDTFRDSSDKDLIHFVARRLVEQDAMDQLTEVTLEDGLAEGFEYILRVPLPGELPEDSPGDPVLDAARDELRSRIARRFRESGVLRG